MTVLVVCETLARGGLETRLFTQATALAARGHRLLFATASEEVQGPLASLAHRVFPGMALGITASARQCAEAAEELARIVREHRVDVVHAHPFASLVGAGLAAALARVPLTVTAHGPTSFTGPPNLDVALFDVVLPSAATIQLVSEELRSLMPTALWPRLHVVPNTVDLSRFELLPAPPARGPWAFVGRLDDGKSRAAETLIRWAPALGIEAVHVIGAGSESEALQGRAEGHDVEVKLLGWRDDLAELLRHGYAGVAGMGRVVLEAAALGLPCILAGYEQLHGLVTPDRFAAIAFSNFSGRGVTATEDPATLAAELEAFDAAKRQALRALVETAHDEARWVERSEALLREAGVVEGARAALLQLHGLFLRAAPGQTPWVIDHAIASGLERLGRSPGVPVSSTQSAQTAALIEASTRRVVAEEHQAVAAELAELRGAVARLSAQVGSLSERLDAVAHPRGQDSLRHAKDRVAAPLERTMKRLRGLLKP